MADQTPDASVIIAAVDPVAVMLALGNPVRWAVLRKLAQDGPQSVNDLAAMSGLGQDSTSRHMTLLYEVGAVVAVAPPDGDGRKQFYAIPPGCLRDGAAGKEVDYGADLLNPTTSVHRVVTATGGTLSFVVAGLDAAIGQAAPGLPAIAATATFSGNGVWDLLNGFATDINNLYGKDNHAFHYIQVPAGDFDIKCHVTGTTTAQAGLMARDNLRPLTGNWAGIWSGVVSGVASNGVMTTMNIGAGGAGWLEVTRIGNIVTTYYSVDGITYEPGQQVDYTAHPWGPTVYLGLDLINTSTAGGQRLL
jgi:DNA-binding transcriptional ArsR family regulator